MDVDKEGKFLIGGGSFGKEYAGGDFGFVRDDDVLGSDDGGRIVRCGDEGGADESLDVAVFVYAKEWVVVVGYLGVHFFRWEEIKKGSTGGNLGKEEIVIVVGKK